MDWSDLISGVVEGPIGLLLRITAILAAVNHVSNMLRGPQMDRWLVEKLLRMRWPVVTALFLGTFLISALAKGTMGAAAMALYALLALSAFIVLVGFGLPRLHLSVPGLPGPLVRGIEAYTWPILTGIFFLPSVTLLAIDAREFAASEPKDQIVFVVDLDDTEFLVLSDILDDLEPELSAEVLLMNVPSGRYVARLDSMVASAQPNAMKWDLIAVDNNTVGMLAAKGLVEDLEQYIRYEEIIPSSLVPALRPLTTYEGNFYFVPFRPNVKIAFYNEEKFAQYGLAPPRTWDQLLEVARVFKEKEGVGRVAIQGARNPAAVTGATVFEFVTAAGGDPLTLDDDGSREAFAFLQELESYLAPEYVETRWDTANELLISDVVYYVDNWTFGIKVVVEDFGKEEIKANSGWKGPAGEVHILGGAVLAVPKGASHPEKAIELIELLSSKETQQTLVARLRWPPARLDVYEVIPSDVARYFQAVNEALSTAVIRPPTPQWTMIEAELDRCFGGLIRGDKDSDIDTLEDCAARLREVPSQYIPYSVEPGDTLEEIAGRYETTVDILAQANGGTSGASIGPGQILLVPRK